MSITFKKSVAVLADQVTVEEAETLLEWLVKPLWQGESGRPGTSAYR
ncbi:hypothetical protein ACFQDN_15275 [Pseudomonas asuensis]